MNERGTYTELRPLLFSIAYRMIGQVTEAEDIVQEAFMRFHLVSDQERSPRPGPICQP